MRKEEAAFLGKGRRNREEIKGMISWFQCPAVEGKGNVEPWPILKKKYLASFKKRDVNIS